MDHLKTSAGYILVTFIFVFAGCSLTLLDFSTANKDLHLSIVKQNTFFDEDSALIRKVTLLNGKETGDTVIARFQADSIDAYDSFLADLLSSDSYPAFNGTGAYYRVKDHITVGPMIEFNPDSSQCILTMSDASALNHTQRTLFLLDMKLLTVRRITTFNADMSYIEEKVPFELMFNRLYDVECAAKWLNESQFILATDEGIYLYSVSDRSSPEKLTFDNAYAGAVPYNGSIIYQNGEGIYTAGPAGTKAGQLSKETWTYLMKLSGDYLFFAKGWTLYRIDLRSPGSEISFNTGDRIKDYYIYDSSTVIINGGNLKEVQQQNNFYRVDLQAGSKELIEETTGKLNDYYLTDDRRYFVISKETIQVKTYHVFTVYDIALKKKYDFDRGTL